MKTTLRKEIVQKRNLLSHAEILEKSTRIQKQLFSLPEFISATRVLFYVSYDNEVFTHDMIKQCLDSGKQVIVPCSDQGKKQLVLSKLYHWDDLSVGAYGILEPKKSAIRKVSVTDVDIILVPGIVFDYCGQRIGHGFGYYDRLLQKAVRSQTIGLAFELQLVHRIPSEKHDVRLTVIITEKRIIVCKKTT